MLKENMGKVAHSSRLYPCHPALSTKSFRTKAFRNGTLEGFYDLLRFNLPTKSNWIMCEDNFKLRPHAQNSTLRP